MTRSKKSRKPSSGAVAPKKLEKTSAVEAKDTRLRKKTGNTPGSRQHAQKLHNDNNATSSNKDPRVGSKKPIELIKDNKVVSSNKTKTEKSTAMPEIRVLAKSDQQDFMAELQAIEQNELLLDILRKQDEEIELTETEVDHFNRLMDRHEFLREKLGLDDDEDELAVANNDHQLSEDELWEKFNNTDFKSEY